MRDSFRYRAHLIHYIVPSVIGWALVLGVFGAQHIAYNGNLKDQRSANVAATTRERMWREISGLQAIPEKQDVVDRFAATLKPNIEPNINKSAGLKTIPLPDAIVDAKIAPNTFTGLTNKLDWCIFDETNNTNTTCRDFGSFNDGFKSNLSDVLSGNVQAHLHQLAPITYHAWPQWALWWWLLLALIIAVVSHIIAFGMDNAEYKSATSFVPQPNDLTAERRAKIAETIINPLVLLQTATINGGGTVLRNIKNAKVKSATTKAETILRTKHPMPNELDKARAVLQQLEAMPEKHKKLPEIQSMLKVARATVRDIEAIPEMIEADEARIKATKLMNELLPVKQDADAYATDHKALMAEYHLPEIQRAMRGLPSAPKPVDPADMQFVDHPLSAEMEKELRDMIERDRD